MNTNPAIEKAMTSVSAAVAKAEADPTRPIYHFRPPALWMNDPNGTIYHNGYYHLFYQHNPYGDDWGHMHWGHARSKNLVHWEHLPIALWPSLDQGEEHVFSGCAAISGFGEAMLIYTSVKTGGREQRPPNEQWAARPLDADWLTWEKHPANPILALETHGGPTFRGDWRDPFIFHEAGRTILVIGGDYDTTAGVALYEANDPTLTRWSYRGLLYQSPTDKVRFHECPNFVKIGNKWILLTAPYRTIEYVTGSFDVQTLTFTPEQEGILDPGVNPDVNHTPNYYATNILFDPQGNCILIGWVRGFVKERGWNGALAIPRILTIGEDGHPRQQPISTMQVLRGRHTSSAIHLKDGSQRIEGGEGNAVEIQAVIDCSQAQRVGFRLGTSTQIDFGQDALTVAGTSTPLPVGKGEKLTLHIFWDRSVIEVFANDGRLAVTRVLEPEAVTEGVTFFAEGSAEAQIDLWSLRSSW